MGNLLQTALFELQQKYPDFIPSSELVERVNGLYSDITREANRLFPEDNDSWERYVIDSYKGKMLQEYDILQPHFPAELYGNFAKGIAEAVAQAYNVSIDIVFASMFAAIGAAVGDKVKVTYGNYTNPLSLWWCMVAPSGYGKTEPVKHILQPLRDINKKMMSDSRDAFAVWRQNNKTGERPRKSQLMVSDTTPEALVELLADNPEGLLLYRDELAGFFNDIGRYNKSGEVENYLSMWSGQGFSVNRKTQDTLFVDSPILSIIGGLQPDRLTSVFGGHGMMDNGFFARWCFVYPVAMVATSIKAQQLRDEINSQWEDFILSLHDEGIVRREITFNDEAARLHDSFYAKVTGAMSDPSTTPRQCEVLAKLRVMVYRFAGIIHFLRNGTAPGDIIDAETMRAAIESVEAIKEWNFKALALTEDTRKVMSKGELLRAVRSMFPDMNVTQFCEAVGMSRDNFNYYFRK